MNEWSILTTNTSWIVISRWWLGFSHDGTDGDSIVSRWLDFHTRMIGSSSRDMMAWFCSRWTMKVASSHDGWIVLRCLGQYPIEHGWIISRRWLGIQSNMIESSHDDGWVFNRTWLNHLTTMVGYSIEHGWIISRRRLDFLTKTVLDQQKPLNDHLTMAGFSHDEDWISSWHDHLSQMMAGSSRDGWIIKRGWLNHLTMMIGSSVGDGWIISRRCFFQTTMVGSSDDDDDDDYDDYIDSRPLPPWLDIFLTRTVRKRVWWVNIDREEEWAFTFFFARIVRLPVFERA